MSKDLFKVAKNVFIVTNGDYSRQFDCIDKACDHLEFLGVPAEEMDFALVDMITKGTTHAHFGVLNGGFILSDNQPYDQRRS